jgi:DNA-binding transcriptional LysR family regulator
MAKMNVHDLETFVSIVQLGGVTRAAGQLHRSQPAITRRVNLLERQLGAPLFERGRGGTMLTEAGRTFLPYVQAVLAALKDGTQAVQALQSEDRGTVSLAIVGNPCRHDHRQTVAAFLGQAQESAPRTAYREQL